MLDVLHSHRIHVVDDDLAVDLVLFYTEVATEISGDNVGAHVAPLSRCVELLVDVTIETERGSTNKAS